MSREKFFFLIYGILNLLWSEKARFSNMAVSPWCSMINRCPRVGRAGGMSNWSGVEMAGSGGSRWWRG